MNNYKINQSGINLLKKFETLKLEAYKPTPNDVFTIGYGHTLNVKKGDVCTLEQAEAWLRQDIEWAENTVNCHCKIELNENQFSALVCIAFNIGEGNFNSSTLLKNLNLGKVKDASNQFEIWDKQRGKVLDGLLKRRLEEKALFDKPV